MAKKENGSGSIRKRSDGRWEGRFVYTDELGAQRRKSVYGSTKTEVSRKIREATAQVDRKQYRDVRRCTFSQWFNEWLELYGSSWKQNTKSGYKRKGESYLIPAFGSVQLTDIRKTAIQRFVNGLSNGVYASLAPKSVINIHGIFHKCLQQAVDDGLISTNPADRIQLPNRVKPKMNPVMDEDIGRFIQACDKDPFGNLYLTALFTGLRQSELLGLKWSDIDFDAGTIHVERQLQKLRESEGYDFVTTKNGKDRMVAFPPSLTAVLKRERNQQIINKLKAGPEWKNADDLVFTNEDGSHLVHVTVQKHFMQFRDSLDLKCRFHDLRHSFATLALQSGANIKAVSEMLGHYSTAFTLDVYADVSKTMQKDVQDKMEAMFKTVSNG